MLVVLELLIHGGIVELETRLFLRGLTGLLLTLNS